jgi:UDP-2-acetamido-3-amino-2,3-dideoxy-glucuronate N-acetyltransferase
MSAFGHRLSFDQHGKAVCPESGENYALIEGQVRLVASV